MQKLEGRFLCQNYGPYSFVGVCTAAPLGLLAELAATLHWFDWWGGCQIRLCSLSAPHWYWLRSHNWGIILCVRFSGNPAHSAL